MKNPQKYKNSPYDMIGIYKFYHFITHITKKFVTFIV